MPKICHDWSDSDTRLSSSKSSIMGETLELEEYKSYQAAFDAFDWGHNGKIKHSSLQAAMRRAGHNPTDVEVLDIINKIDDNSGYLDFQDFCYIMGEQTKLTDLETGYKETFRVFSKDEEGCIPAEEIKFVLMHLPGKITYREIDEMIKTVDKNEDGKISYSEFRVMLGAIPLIVHNPPVKPVKPDREDGEEEDGEDKDRGGEEDEALIAKR